MRAHLQSDRSRIWTSPIVQLPLLLFFARAALAMPSSNGQYVNGQIRNGQMRNGYMSNGYMTNGQITNGQIMNGYMANGQIVNGQYVNGYLVNGYMSNGQTINCTIANGVVSCSAAHGQTIATALIVGVGINFVLTNATVSTNGQIVNGQVTNSLTTNQMSAGQITNGQIMNGQYTNGQYVNGQSVGSGYMFNVLMSSGVTYYGALMTGGKIVSASTTAGGALSTGTVPSGAFVSAQLVQGLMTNGQYVNGYLANGQIANGVITAASFIYGTSATPDGTMSFVTQSQLVGAGLFNQSIYPSTFNASATGNVGQLYNRLVAALKRVNGHMVTDADCDAWATSGKVALLPSQLASANTCQYFDTYELMAFEYIINSAAMPSTTFVVSYVGPDGLTYSRSFPGGLGLCESSNTWISTTALANPAAFDYGCGQWVSAALSLFTQPTGIHNAISVRNFSKNDDPTLASLLPGTTLYPTQSWDGTSIESGTGYFPATGANPSEALLTSAGVIPLPYKRGVSMYATSSGLLAAQEGDPRVVASLNGSHWTTAAIVPAAGASANYSGTANLDVKNGGWAPGYTLRCQGGNVVHFNIDKLSSNTAAIPGGGGTFATANPVLRLCKGVHGCDTTDADFVSEQVDRSTTDVWPELTFTCGAGYAEVPTANQNKYYFLYNWMVRSTDGNLNTAQQIANKCANPALALGTASTTQWAASYANCVSTTASTTPPRAAATSDSVPATEPQVFTQHEGVFYGSLFSYSNPSAITNEYWFSTTTANVGKWTVDKTHPITNAVQQSCELRNVADPFDNTQEKTISWSPLAITNVTSPQVVWPALVGTVPNAPVMSVARRSNWRAWCSMWDRTQCIQCFPPNNGTNATVALPAAHWTDTNGNGRVDAADAFEATSVAPANGVLQASADFAPYLGVLRDSQWAGPPQNILTQTAPVDLNYYNATRVCSQDNDFSNQGYCFAEQDGQLLPWNIQSPTASLSGGFTDVGPVESTVPTNNYTFAGQPRSLQGRTSTAGLSVFLPQAIQAVAVADRYANCPSGFTLLHGMCAKAGAAANNASCNVDTDCASLHCECVDATCSAWTRKCVPKDCPTCTYYGASGCAATNYLANGAGDAEECVTQQQPMNTATSGYCNGAGACTVTPSGHAIGAACVTSGDCDSLICDSTDVNGTVSLNRCESVACPACTYFNGTSCAGIMEGAAPPTPGSTAKCGNSAGVACSTTADCAAGLHCDSTNVSGTPSLNKCETVTCPACTYFNGTSCAGIMEGAAPPSPGVAGKCGNTAGLACTTTADCATGLSCDSTDVNGTVSLNKCEAVKCPSCTYFNGTSCAGVMEGNAPPAPGTAGRCGNTLGLTCASNADCAAGLWCDSTDVNGTPGLNKCEPVLCASCTYFTGASCTGTMEGLAHALPGQTTTCGFTTGYSCNADTDCAAGLACDNTTPTGTPQCQPQSCSPYVAGHAAINDCYYYTPASYSAGWGCTLPMSTCERVVGAACTSGAQCGSNQCLGGTCVASTSDGLFLVGNLGHYPMLYESQSTGQPTTISTAQWGDSANNPVAMVAVPETHMLYALQGGTLFIINPTNGSFEELSSWGNWYGAGQMAAVNGYLFIQDGSYIFKVSPIDGSYTVLNSDAWDDASAMTGMDGHLFIVQDGDLWQMETDTGGFTSLGPWGADAVLMTGLNSTLYIYSNANDRLYQVNPYGAYGNFAYFGTNTFAASTGMTTWNGYIYMKDIHGLYRVNSAGQYLGIAGTWTGASALTALW